MSFELTSLAFARTDLKSSTKFVLIALAFRANTEKQCWPSITCLAKDTKLDRKTVMNAIQTLIEKGLVIKTGTHKGRTRSVPVYQLQIEAVPKTGLLKKEAVPIFPSSSTKSGTTKQYQKRDIEYKDRIEREYKYLLPSYVEYASRQKGDLASSLSIDQILEFWEWVEKNYIS